MTKAITHGLAALLACTLFACAGEGSEETTTEQSGTDPTLWSGNNGGAVANEESRAANDRGDLANANGATARTITHNHPQPHELVIPALDLASGKGGTYTLTNGGGALGELHVHEVSLTAQQLGEIRDGAQLSIETSVGGIRGGHTHTVTIARR